MPLELSSLETLLAAAVEITDQAERDAYVERACGDDAACRAELQSMVRDYFAAASLFDRPPPLLATMDQPLAPCAGAFVGPYKLLEQIGEGGMGLVYMAEQQRPMRRLVALKLIKPGMDSHQVIARFEAEKQALAMMDHPNIAKVFEAGTTESSRQTPSAVAGNDGTPSVPTTMGRPYFAMELVRGIPINEFCEQKRLTIRQRLELFIQVCQAVQHAHQKGIIHRDLKPTNVLVTLHDVLPVPKVIDFGIAKALGAQLTEHTLHTGFAQLVGTPLYMSPEQAEMNALGVDTRSDVYSLGVLLYELLTGTTPFDKDRLKSVGLDELRRIIREEEPETVSARLAKTRRAGFAHQTPLPLGEGARRAGEGASIPQSAIRNPQFAELDWIVMKSLEKDRSRRYESASALASDIQRYLSDEPVLACPPTTMYRFQKFARKHKPALATAAAIALCLLLGTTVSAWQAVRATTAEAQATANELKANANATEAQAQATKATEQRDEAQKQRDEVKSLNDKLQRTLYAAHMNLANNAWIAGGIDRVRVLLDQHAPKPGEADLRGFEWHYLHRLSNSELLRLPGHTAGVDSLAFSPDGNRLVSASKDQTVKVWNTQTGKELLTFKGHKSRVQSVAFSPDGKRVASGSDDVIVKVWDPENGREFLTLKAGTLCLAFSPDGKRLATGANGPGIDIKLWDSQTGQNVLTLKGHTGWIGGLAFSPDGKRLASASLDNTVKIWDANTGLELLSFQGGENGVAFSPDGNLVANSAEGDTVKVWDVRTGQEFLTAKVGQVTSVVFAPDGQRLITSSYAGTWRILELQTGREIRAIKGGGHALAVSPDGRRLASSSGSHDIKIWDAQQDQQEGVTLAGGGQQCVRFSPDGRHVASVSGDRTVKVWDTQNQQEMITLTGHTVPILTFAISPDGKRLASGGGGRIITEGKPGSGSSYRAELKLWDLQTGRELFDIQGLDTRVSTVAFSPDGKHLASASGQYGPSGSSPFAVKLWNVQTGQADRLFSGHTGGIRTLAFSPDGSRLAGGSAPGTDGVTVWNTLTGEIVLTLKGHSAWITSVCFSPDGRRLATSSADRTAKVYDAQTGQELLSLEGHNFSVNSVAFCPDGLRLATASSDRTLKVWDAKTGQELLTIQTPKWPSSVAFSPNGRHLACDANGSVKIYDATPLPEKP